MSVHNGKFRKPRWRFLRSYQRMAREQHECVNCTLPIMPGEQYVGEVRVWESRDYGNRNKLEVRKYHLECPEDPDRERWEREFDDFVEECQEHECEMSEPDSTKEPMVA